MNVTPRASAVDALEALGSELNSCHYQAVHLAARYDDELEWFHQGLPNGAMGIARRLQMHTSTAREWIRIGHCLRELPLIDAAFAANELSYAKVRIVTRWAEPHTEERLLTLARERSANRLTAAIARLLADGEESDQERDQRLHEGRSFSSYTDGDGMVVIRVVLPPASAKPVVAAVEELVSQIARTPVDAEDPPADASDQRIVTDSGAATTERGQNPPAGGSSDGDVRRLLREVERQRPAGGECSLPSLAQQRADAFVALFCGSGAKITTEVVIHVRGDGNTFDDGTPLTTSAVARQLDGAFIRLLLHDAQQRPVNASARRRHPTTRQKRVVAETFNHECVECQSTSLIEFDHNPPYEQTGHTITTELELRCAPCHRARHRAAA